MNLAGAGWTASKAGEGYPSGRHCRLTCVALKGIDLSKLSDAAYQWLKKNAAPEGATSNELWVGMQADYPQLTEITENRKTPRNTLMRDMRLDERGRFRKEAGRIKIVTGSDH